MIKREFTTKNVVSGCVVRSEHQKHIKCKINCHRTFKRLHNGVITRKASKEVQKEPPEVFYKKMFLKILQY